VRSRILVAVVFMVSTSFLESAAVSAQTSVLDLSSTEQMLHRWAFCSEAASSVSGGEFDKGEIGAISVLLYETRLHTRDHDPNQVHHRARNDTAAAILTGRLVVDQDLLDRCDRDMHDILAERYVPNFSYVGERSIDPALTSDEEPKE